jgi:hypothetical protein
LIKTFRVEDLQNADIAFFVAFARELEVAA